MKKLIVFLCVWGGLMTYFDTFGQVPNDSIWITSGANILATAHRTHDTLANGNFSKTGDFTTICNGSSINLTINYNKPIHHCLWVTNLGASFNTFTITPTPANPFTDYYCYVYEDVLGVGILKGTVMVTVFTQQPPTLFDRTMDGVNTANADYCVGGVTIGYTGSQVDCTYQLQMYGTSTDVGLPFTGTGNAFTLPFTVPVSQYQMKITNNNCTVVDSDPF